MAKHARLSASGAERWLTCPASVPLVASLEKTGMVGGSSPYAEEGTLAHELALLHLQQAFGLITERQFNSRLSKWIKKNRLPDDVYQEMTTHVTGYVHFVQYRASQFPHSSVLFEQRLDSGIEEVWGTSDTVIVSPRHVEIIDLKYGMGIHVAAEGNPQLRIYALGALDSYADLLGETEVIIMSIYQPRIDNISVVEMTPEDLRAWREEIRPIARVALEGNGEFHPTESACRFCPAAGVCRARMEAVTSVDFATDPEVLSEDELGDLLGRLPTIRQWCDDVLEAALHRAYSLGQAIPQWKVVLSGGKRVVTDQEGALEALRAAGYDDEEIMNKKAKGIVELEKLLGRRQFGEILSPYITRTPGKPALAPESDGRPAVSPATQAAKDFDDGPEL